LIVFGALSHLFFCETIVPVKVEEEEKLIDLLQQPVGDAQTFTVDNTQAFVDLNNTPSLGVLTARNGDKVFTRGDNFNILSVGVVMPINYQIYPNSVGGHITTGIEFFVKENAGASTVPVDPEGVVLPFGSYEMNLGAYFDVENVPYDFNLYFGIDKMRISMVGVPDSENGKVYSVPVFAKVEHTIEVN